MADIWYYTMDGQRMGPAAPSELRKLIARGLLKANDLVWHPDMPNWTPVAMSRDLMGDDRFALRTAETIAPVVEPAPDKDIDDFRPRRRTAGADLVNDPPELGFSTRLRQRPPAKGSAFKTSAVIVGTLLSLVLTGVGLYYALPRTSGGALRVRNFKGPRNNPLDFTIVLFPSQREKSLLPLDADCMYEVIVKSEPASNIILFVRDDTDALMAKDTNLGPEAYVAICTRKRGNYELEVKNESGVVTKLHVAVVRRELRVAPDAPTPKVWQGSFTVDKLDVGAQHSELVPLAAGRHTISMTSEPNDGVNDVDVWVTRLSDGVRVGQDLTFGPRGEVILLAQANDQYRISVDNPIGSKETASNIVVRYK